MKKTNLSIKPNLSNLARMVVYLSMIAIIIVCAVLLPELAREESVGQVNPPPAYPYLIGAWVLSIPIFIALHQTLKIIKYIDENRAFSNLSIIAVKNIKYCSIIFNILFIIGVIVTIIHDRNLVADEDITPIITIGFIFSFASSVMTTFMAVLQKFLQDAINIKFENDMTV